MHQKLEKAKAFVQKNKVPLACGAGIAVGVIVTRKLDARLFSDYLYKAGVQNGFLGVHLDMAFTFIEDKGLWDEYLQYGPKFAEIGAERVADRVMEATESIVGK
jgi:hypothetical protein